MWPRRRGRGLQNMGVLLLLMQMLQAGFDRIPPVTLGTIGLNVSVYLHLIHQFLNIRVPSLQEVCIGVQSVWYYRDYSRLLYGAFYHADDWHLYYNMVSFLWKGIYLERKLGSIRFFYMLAVFTAAVNVLLLYLGYLAMHLTHDIAYLKQCAVGFSGVIFAVKVVSTYYMPPGTNLIMGFIPVNSRLACWFELILIQVLVPNASFTGHLAGILVGLAYVKGPLKYIMDIVANIFTLPGQHIPQRPSYTYRTGTTATNHENYTQYTGGLDENEQFQRAMNESLQDFPEEPTARQPSAPPSPPPPGWNIPENNPLSDEEIRRRRLQRFDR